jgi:hypothetical protein
VFSGALPDAPRCATIQGARMVSKHRTRFAQTGSFVPAAEL